LLLQACLYVCLLLFASVCLLLLACSLAKNDLRIVLAIAIAIAIGDLRCSTTLSRHAQHADRGPRVPPQTDKPTNRQIIEANDERGAERRGRERQRQRNWEDERMRGREKEIGGKSTARSGRKNEDHMRARKRERKEKGDSR
jgi:hypothetical protein